MRRVALLLVPLLLFACDRQPVAPEVGMAPDFGASVTNEVVYLHPSRGTWMDNDQYAGEPWDVAVLGYEPSENPRCNAGEWGGDGIPTREHHVVSMEGIPDEFSQRDQYLLTTIGRPPLYLYLRADFPDGGTDEEWCAFWTEGWIASGHWSATISHDNEMSYEDNTPGMNPYGGAEAGILWGTAGEMYKYEWKWLRQWDRTNGTDELIRHVDHVVRIK